MVTKKKTTKWYDILNSIDEETKTLRIGEQINLLQDTWSHRLENYFEVRILYAILIGICLTTTNFETGTLSDCNLLSHKRAVLVLNIFPKWKLSLDSFIRYNRHLLSVKWLNMFWVGLCAISNMCIRPNYTIQTSFPHIKRHISNLVNKQR